jgi:hypothetical protein
LSNAPHHQGYATIKIAVVAEAPTATANSQLSQFASLCIFYITNSQQTKISCRFVSDDEKNKAGHHQGHATIK